MRAVQQALLLRGSRDFATRAAYETFLAQLLKQLNAGRRERLAEELRVLRPLPDRRPESYKRVGVRVDSGSLIHVDRNVCSVSPEAVETVVRRRQEIPPETEVAIEAVDLTGYDAFLSEKEVA